MNTEQLINIAQHLIYEGGENDTGRAAWSLYPDYSRRFMYGKCCLGITFRPGDEFQAISAFVEALEYEGCDAEAEIVRSNPHSGDSMGLDAIAYWPSIETPDDFDREKYAAWEEREAHGVN